ncbi:hypothetical protein SH580_04025 [Coraliomargarita algicola]|uniref:Lipoprotein n=1 Tax=Coraliomargarita algicola TaxID=3092156 RepID=A0ABZ0RN74_9BACT|nr:hypothetical protein [Coraliomargarita sp. J2-16]WPJ96873.1 hypothetical protein SH580_04025 [Coraliomargarita sp. J2-16]
MKIHIYMLLLSMAFIGACSKGPSKADNHLYSDSFGSNYDYQYFNEPKTIVSGSGAVFQVIGWVVYERSSDHQESMALRLLCNWPKETIEEEQVYTPAKILVDGHNLQASAFSFQHSNIKPNYEGQEAGLQPFVLTQINMPKEWKFVEIHFEGMTPGTLEIKNIDP